MDASSSIYLNNSSQTSLLQIIDEKNTLLNRLPTHIIQVIRYYTRPSTPFLTKTNFAGPNFIPKKSIAASRIDELINQGVFESKVTVANGYFKNDIQKRYNLKENGFLYCSLSKTFQEKLERFVGNGKEIPSPSKTTKIFAALREFFEVLAKQQELEFDLIIPVNCEFRSEDPSSHKKKPSKFFHVDFQRGNPDFLKALQVVWKPIVANALRTNITDQEFENLPIEQMYNVWIPLNKSPTENTLAVMDRVNQAALVPFISSGDRFTLMSIKYNENQNIVFQRDMAWGDCVIFNTFENLHTSITVPRHEALKRLIRESIEFRIFILKKPIFLTSDKI